MIYNGADLDWPVGHSVAATWAAIGPPAHVILGSAQFAVAAVPGPSYQTNRVKLARGAIIFIFGAPNKVGGPIWVRNFILF